MNSLTLDSISFASAPSFQLGRSSTSSLPPLQFKTLIPVRNRVVSLSHSPRGGLVAVQCFNLKRRTSLNRTVVALAASHEESHSEHKIEKEEGSEESQEEWKQALESFKEQALKMQSVSQEAYDMYSKKATVILQETSERLKIQADKASQDLSVILKEVSEEGKVYLSNAAENSPEPVKEIVETYASSTEEVTSFSQLQDFHIGIPYGAGLSVGGFLLFMLTGNVSSIRFGVILGGALFALSIYSLRSWKNGESSPLAIKGQAAIAGILFLRELRLLTQRVTFSTLLATLFSGAMAATYAYKFVLAGSKTNPKQES